MTKSDRYPSIPQIDLKRRWLRAKVSRGSKNLSDIQQNEIVAQIGALDLELAATPAESVEDLLVKLEHLAEAMFDQSGEPDTYEGILFSAILADTRALAEQELGNCSP